MKVVKKAANEIAPDEAYNGKENCDSYILLEGYIETVIREDHEIPEESYPDTYEDVQDSFDCRVTARLAYSHREISPM